jgi:NAD-specific glutamate dehydrogenase
MRIGIVNDDMPFLVDSVANAIAARQLTIHRLLHPVVCVERDDKGVLQDVEPLCDDKSRRESMMYIELDRADARGRQELAAEIARGARRRPRRGARLAASCRRRCARTPPRRGSRRRARCSTGSPTAR